MAESLPRTNYKIMIPLPPKIDPSVTMMQVIGSIEIGTQSEPLSKRSRNDHR